jgi:MoxR-like ATPase
VLLIDELDKGDVDLPNDLLVVFEEGVFEIPELARLPKIQEQVDVMVTGDDTRAAVLRGKVRCRDFPVVVITSNGEREFPPAFLRRCVRLDLPEPTGERLREIVRAHLGDAGLTRAESLIDTFIQRRDLEGLATDQLLNAVHLRLNGVDLSAEKLLDSVLHRIGDSGSGLT